jgi:hypothetical protein
MCFLARQFREVITVYLHGCVYLLVILQMQTFHNLKWTSINCAYQTYFLTEELVFTEQQMSNEEK